MRTDIHALGRAFAHFDTVSRARSLTDRESRSFERVLKRLDTFLAKLPA